MAAGSAARTAGTAGDPPGGRTMAATVAARLRNAILSGEYAVGARLPTEAVLTERFGVSRTVVREAIAALRSEGLVESRQGSGVYVQKPASQPVMPYQDIDLTRISSVLEVLELRAAVEIEAAGLAAIRRSPAQEEEILARHRAFAESVETGDAGAEADLAFHLAIAEATNNPRFGEFLRMLGESSIPRAALTRDRQAKVRAAYLQQIVAEHGALTDAILAGDAAGAREAMRTHLKVAQRRYRDLIRPGL